MIPPSILTILGLKFASSKLRKFESEFKELLESLKERAKKEGEYFRIVEKIPRTRIEISTGYAGYIEAPEGRYLQFNSNSYRIPVDYIPRGTVRKVQTSGIEFSTRIWTTMIDLATPRFIEELESKYARLEMLRRLMAMQMGV